LAATQKSSTSSHQQPIALPRHPTLDPPPNSFAMVSYYDELEIEDFAWDEAAKVFHYPCPCGDRFEISKSQLRDGEEIATCPSCSLIIRVIYDYVSYAWIATLREITLG
jgi:diphthamide biosynthesis protein 3